MHVNYLNRERLIEELLVEFLLGALAQQYGHTWWVGRETRTGVYMCRCERLCEYVLTILIHQRSVGSANHLQNVRHRVVHIPVMCSDIHVHVHVCCHGTNLCLYQQLDFSPVSSAIVVLSVHDDCKVSVDGHSPAQVARHHDHLHVM